MYLMPLNRMLRSVAGIKKAKGSYIKKRWLTKRLVRARDNASTLQQAQDRLS